MANALKAINRRVNELAKRHPKSKRTSLQKQAGREWKAGKLKRKAAPKKKAARKVAGKRKYKVTHRVRKVGKVAGPKKRRRSAPRKKAVKAVRRTRTITRYKVVRGPRRNDKTLLTLGAIAIGGLLIYGLTKGTSSTSTLPPINLSGNPARDNAAQNLVAYAQAANLGIGALTNLINSINSWGDSSVISASTQVSSGTSDIGDIAVLPPSGGPSIHLG